MSSVSIMSIAGIYLDVNCIEEIFSFLTNQNNWGTAMVNVGIHPCNPALSPPGVLRNVSIYINWLFVNLHLPPIVYFQQIFPENIVFDMLMLDVANAFPPVPGNTYTPMRLTFEGFEFRPDIVCKFNPYRGRYLLTAVPRTSSITRHPDVLATWANALSSS